jgi:transcription antitermination factor NusG
MTWRLAVSAPGAERAVAERLARQQLPHHIFRHAERRVLRGRAQDRLVPTFPRYVFIWSPPGSDALHAVRETYQVVAMVNGTVPQQIMDSLLARADRDAIICFPKAEEAERFLPGERVRVAGGPYQGFDAIWSCRTGAARCRVLLGMMGRQVPIDMDDAWLEAARERGPRAKRPYWRPRGARPDAIAVA